MHELPNQCPICQSDIVVTRFRCAECDIVIEGQFSPAKSAFAQLSAEQLRFVEIFVKCEGKLNRIEGELELSYPTIRARLTDIIRKLGYEPGKEEAQPEPRRKGAGEQERRSILDAIDSGAISLDDALKQLGANAGAAKTKED